MQTVPEVSVVIVTWKSREDIVGCLEALLRQQSGMVFDVWVIDNASGDGTDRLVRERFPNVHCLVNGKNRGFAAAANQGIHASRGNYVLLLNPDATVAPDALVSLAEFFEADPDVGIVGGRLLNLDGTIQPSVRGFPTFASQALILLKLHHVVRQARALRTYFQADFPYEKQQDVAQVKGAFFCIRRRMLERIGFLDERFWIWFEEVDLCKRAHDAGWRVCYLPEATATHAGARSFRKRRPLQNEWHFLRSMVTYFQKHRPLQETIGLIALAPIALFLSLLQTAWSIRQRP